MRKRLPGLLVVLAVGCSSRGEDTREIQRFNTFVDEHFSAYFKMRPVEATAMGIHDDDHLLGQFEPEPFAGEVARLKSALTTLESFRDDRLDSMTRLDRQILSNSIRDSLLDVEEVARWQKNPSFYNEIITTGILQLIERSFAPKRERLRLAIERERQIPSLLEAAKRNLDRPPRALTEIAIDQFRGSVTFFRDVVPKAFEDSTSQELKAQLQEENRKVVASCADFVKFLEKDVLPRSTQEFALGEDFLSRKLRYREMVDEPMAVLERKGFERLREVQADFIGIAKKVDPAKTPAEVLDAVTRDHPSTEGLIPAVRGLLEELRTFCIQKDIITIPSEVRCEVTETPPFARTLTIASLDSPGPYEPVAKEVYYKITLPDPGWSQSRTEEHLRFFNFAALPTISAYETYPGRYIQHLWMKPVASKVSRLIRSDFFELGWAHYAEEMVLDQGYRANEPKVRLAQQRNSLLRLARFLTAIGLHSGRMTPGQSVEFFVTEAYQERANAERETRRSVSDPVRAMAYALGKLEIVALRQDYEKKKRNAFSLREFHSELLRHGAPPIPILRKILLDSSEKPGSTTLNH